MLTLTIMMVKVWAEPYLIADESSQSFNLQYVGLVCSELVNQTVSSSVVPVEGNSADPQLYTPHWIWFTFTPHTTVRWKDTTKTFNNDRKTGFHKDSCFIYFIVFFSKLTYN